MFQNTITYTCGLAVLAFDTLFQQFKHHKNHVTWLQTAHATRGISLDIGNIRKIICTCTLTSCLHKKLTVKQCYWYQLTPSSIHIYSASIKTASSILPFSQNEHTSLRNVEYLQPGFEIEVKLAQKWNTAKKKKKKNTEAIIYTIFKQTSISHK